MPSNTSDDAGSSALGQDSSTDTTVPINRPDDTAVPPARPSPRVHYPLNIETDVGNMPTIQSAPAGLGVPRSDPGPAYGDAFSPEPLRRRRSTRVGNFRTVDDFDDFEFHPGWRPGQEPGVDPNKADGGHASMPTLSAPCDITVVDFCSEDIAMHRLDNDSLAFFLEKPQPKWAKCRWINVNGLSWDVIQSLGKYKKLHRLAIEDIMNTRNRTKAEWYPTHAFIVLTLLKLVHLDDSYDSDGVERTDASSLAAGRRSWFQKVSGALFSGRKEAEREELERGKTPGASGHAATTRSPDWAANDASSLSTGSSGASETTRLRSLQRYHAAPNDPRTQFMEEHSALGSKGLAVACEQVSVFIAYDNTIISFFEVSAQDIEAPIVRRLQTADTILRQSCDASMVGQAIVDAIIDLAIPVTACYGDAIGDLELDVLTRPNLSHTKRLYIIITEINKMLGFITPIVNLIQALRDHKTDMSQDAALKELQNPLKGVIITPMTYTYLGDVLDHCLIITESLNQLKGSADGMIDLIFNTVSASQNESMRQLTVVTIIFLPLTFMTGYFGQNFQPFDDLQRGINYFWMIAVPVVTFTILVLMKDIIFNYLRSLLQRRHIGRLRKTRRRRGRSKSIRG